MNMVTQSEPPKSGYLFGGSFWLAVLFVSVQPFANIAADYTRHNRDKEGCYVVHMVTPPSCCQYRSDSQYIIAWHC